MTSTTPRVRMFAGPNGSGKSTIKGVLPAELRGTYINPDEIERHFRDSTTLDLAFYGLNGREVADLPAFFQASSLIKRAGLEGQINQMEITGWTQLVSLGSFNSYLASVLADFIRRKLLESRKSFSFETVMSSEDKVKLMAEAQRLGYRTYLYYVATTDPLINISRVGHRVRQGGHDVPEEKIVSRYWRSLDLLLEAIKCSHRAYIFDNSQNGGNLRWIAEAADGKILELKTDIVPAWFRASVLDKLGT